MSAIEHDGQRSVQVDVELPGSPEQVWQAVATGPGLSAWFTPTRLDERAGGPIEFDLGAGISSHGEIDAWEPPHRLAYQESDWSEDAPPLLTEVTVEPLPGGQCRLRMRHSIGTDQDRWDAELASMEQGWPPFLEVLRVYLRHYAGQPSASLRLNGRHPGELAEAGAALLASLNLAEAAPGERRTAPDTAPTLSGTVERISEQGPHRETMLHLDQPARGVALVGAFAWSGATQVAISLYFYGAEAAATAAAEGPRWRAWLEQHFPGGEDEA